MEIVFLNSMFYAESLMSYQDAMGKPNTDIVFDKN